MNTENLKKIFKNRKFLLIFAGVLIIVIIIILQFFSTPPQLKPESTPESQILTSPIPTKSVQEIKAIADQTKEDEKFANWERTTVAQYPWINTIPLRTDSYFVYFELDRGRFIGLLYPKAGEDVEDIKTEIMTQLKEVKGIPADNFEFKWTVFPE